MKYVKKQIVINAEIYDGENNPFGAIKMKELGGGYRGAIPVIETLEGDMIINKEDYVIKGVKGEFYPCKPDIFALTYEKL